jgi:hypothetical protein
VDLNLDGIPDLVAATQGIDVLLGLGGGAFGPPKTSMLLAGSANAFAVADLNDDGRPDVATASTGIDVAWGAGDGSFFSVSTLQSADTYESVGVADLNNDQQLDLFASTNANSGIAVFLNMGLRKFAPQSGITTGAGVNGAIAADLDGDGSQDLAAAEYAGVEFFVNNGDGTFKPGQRQSTATRLVAIGAADMDGDGRIDLLAASRVAAQLIVLINNSK